MTLRVAWFASPALPGEPAQEFVSTAEHSYGVGVHRLVIASQPLRRGERLFTFVG